jgi:glucose-specific phosphotransferase system IIA component
MQEIYSPINGRITNIENVNDEMFSMRILGDGVALIPHENEFYSPMDGEVVMIFDTQHAIGIRGDDGTELLIHIGIDTVNLKGVPFDTRVKVGDCIRQGDLLTIIDWGYIRSKGMDVIVPIIVTNRSIAIETQEMDVSVGDILFHII